jgi:hypothetical protein
VFGGPCRYGRSTVGRAVLAQLSIVLFNYLFTYASIKLQRPRFERIRPYVEDVDGAGSEEVKRGVTHGQGQSRPAGDKFVAPAATVRGNLF